MKVLWIMLTVYMAFLSAYPCYDKDCREETMEITSEHDEDGCGGEAKTCTPFCASACCSIHVINDTWSSFNSVPGFSSGDESFYISGRSPGVIVPVWQPPKVA